MKRNQTNRLTSLRYALLLPLFTTTYSYATVNTESISSVLRPAIILSDTVKYNNGVTLTVNGNKKLTDLSEAEINQELDKALTSISDLIKKVKPYAQNLDLSRNEAKLDQFLTDIEFKTTGFGNAKIQNNDKFRSFFKPERIKQFQSSLSNTKKEFEKAKKLKTKEEKAKALQQIQMSLMQEGFFADLFKMVLEEMPSMLSSTLNSAIQQNGGTLNVNGEIAVDSVIMANPNDFEVDTVMAGEQTLSNETTLKNNEKFFDTAYTLKPEQIKISNLPYRGFNNGELVSVERGDKETRVTIALPIHQPFNWIRTDSNFVIIDRKTNDRYFVRSIEKNIPVNQVVVIKGYARKMLELTYVFPPLKKSVKMVDITELTPSNVELPNNSSKNLEFINININEYIKKQVKGHDYR